MFATCASSSQHLSYKLSESTMDMGDLSDSASTNGSRSNSRPVTPPAPDLVQRRSDSFTEPQFEADPAQSHPYTLAVKLQKILGLQPETLAYARAALEHARDEVRRTADVDSARGALTPAVDDVSSWRGSRTVRKRHGANDLVKGVREVIKGVGLNVGGQKEEETRERRRRATDGLIYWQKEVARMEAEAGL